VPSSNCEVFGVLYRYRHTIGTAIICGGQPAAAIENVQKHLQLATRAEKIGQGLMNIK
jgi:hypothetical protein